MTEKLYTADFQYIIVESNEKLERFVKEQLLFEDVRSFLKHYTYEDVRVITICLPEIIVGAGSNYPPILTMKELKMVMGALSVVADNLHDNPEPDEDEEPVEEYHKLIERFEKYRAEMEKGE